ncbi:hypothetical protein P7L78_03345 (plasmid) [Tistrella bauzanensis]|uniref:hypothetical protein n=2 Tax=Tistrella TaxID=171436 RepID=UPI0031F63F4E
MPCYVLRLEGVNFADTIYDTQNLSVIRGSGLALLDAADWLACRARDEFTSLTLKHQGASQAVFTFDADDDAAAEARRNAVEQWMRQAPAPSPLRYLSVMVDIARIDGDDIDAAEHVATACNRARQMQTWSLPLPAFNPEINLVDGLNRVLPADSGKMFAYGDGPERPAAVSVEVRRQFGISQRHRFYGDQIGSGALAGHNVVTTTQHMVDQPPNGLPQPAQNKIAIIYADGNKFGTIRDELATSGSAHDAAGRMSRELQDLRKSLLSAVMSWFKARAADEAILPYVVHMETDAREKNGAAEPQYRFETLMWGGDEFAWIVPAWLALPLAQLVFEVSADWKIGGHALTHAMGIAICDRKASVRQARSIAEALANGAKKAMAAPENRLRIAAFESLSLPEQDLDRHLRARLPAAAEDMAAEIDKHLSLPGNKLGDLFDRLRVLTGPQGLPTSQVHRLLRLPPHDYETQCAAYFDNPGRRTAMERKEIDIWPGDPTDQIRDEIRSLLLAAELGDYVNAMPPVCDRPSGAVS